MLLLQIIIVVVVIIIITIFSADPQLSLQKGTMCASTNYTVYTAVFLPLYTVYNAVHLLLYLTVYTAVHFPLYLTLLFLKLEMFQTKFV